MANRMNWNRDKYKKITSDANIPRYHNSTKTKKCLTYGCSSKTSIEVELCLMCHNMQIYSKYRNIK